MLDTGFFSKKFTKKPTAALEEIINQVLSSESYETELFEATLMPVEPIVEDKQVHQSWNDDFDLIKPNEVPMNTDSDSMNGVLTTLSSSGKSIIEQ